MTATEGFMKAEIKKLEKENKQLKENIETLELRLKNKDELLEEYRKQIDKLKIIDKKGLLD